MIIAGSQTIPTYAMHTREQRIFEPIGDVYINLEVNTGGEVIKFLFSWLIVLCSVFPPPPLCYGI